MATILSRPQCVNQAMFERGQEVGIPLASLLLADSPSHRDNAPWQNCTNAASIGQIPALSGPILVNTHIEGAWGNDRGLFQPWWRWIHFTKHVFFIL